MEPSQALSGCNKGAALRTVNGHIEAVKIHPYNKPKNRNFLKLAIFLLKATVLAFCIAS